MPSGERYAMRCFVSLKIITRTSGCFGAEADCKWSVQCLFHEVTDYAYDLFLLPDDKMVLAFDDMHLGIGVDVHVFLAAPQWDRPVLRTVYDAYRALEAGRDSVDVQVLCLEHIVPAKFEVVEALDVLRRVSRVEAFRQRDLHGQATLRPACCELSDRCGHCHNHQDRQYGEQASHVILNIVYEHGKEEAGHSEGLFPDCNVIGLHVEGHVGCKNGIQGFLRHGDKAIRCD